MCMKNPWNPYRALSCTIYGSATARASLLVKTRPPHLLSTYSSLHTGTMRSTTVPTAWSSTVEPISGPKAMAILMKTRATTLYVADIDVAMDDCLLFSL